MSRHSSLLCITVVCAAAVAAHRILKPSATAGQWEQASAGTDSLMCISKRAAAAGELADVEVEGIVPLEYGGEVAAGDPLTADAQGRGVLATDDDRVIAYAWESGVLGTIGSARIALSTQPTPGV